MQLGLHKYFILNSKRAIVLNDDSAAIISYGLPILEFGLTENFLYFS